MCKKCGIEKALVLFHKHSGMKDGHLHACKACVYAYQKERRKLPAVRAARVVENQRGRDLRREANRRWKKTAKGKAALARYGKKVAPEKHSARVAVYQALKSGTLKRLPCEVCGDLLSVAHHSSYAKDMRLCVTWLCTPHHNQLHLEHERAISLNQYST